MQGISGESTGMIPLDHPGWNLAQHERIQDLLGEIGGAPLVRVDLIAAVNKAIGKGLNPQFALKVVHDVGFDI